MTPFQRTRDEGPKFAPVTVSVKLELPAVTPFGEREVKFGNSLPELGGFS